MSLFWISTEQVRFGMFAESERQALEQAVDSTLLVDGDEGNIEPGEEEA